MNRQISPTNTDPTHDSRLRAQISEVYVVEGLSGAGTFPLRDDVFSVSTMLAKRDLFLLHLHQIEFFTKGTAKVAGKTTS